MPVTTRANIKGYDRYMHLIADFGKEAIGDRYRRGRAEPILTAAEFKHLALFKQWPGITQAVEHLDLCLKFVQRRMPSSKDIPPHAYLQYHVTFYLQEIYILEERMRAYATLIERRRKAFGLPVNSAAYAAQLKALRDSLAGVALTRGRHVHEEPFEDRHISDLGIFVTLRGLGREGLEDHVKERYAEAREKWAGLMRKNRAVLKAMLDQYCDFLFDEVTKGDRPLIGDPPLPVRWRCEVVDGETPTV